MSLSLLQVTRPVLNHGVLAEPSLESHESEVVALTALARVPLAMYPSMPVLALGALNSASRTVFNCLNVRWNLFPEVMTTVQT